MPRLVTKLPEGKDPVICICFEKMAEAQKTNEDLVNTYHKDRYVINIWPGDEKARTLNLMLISLDDANNQRLYKNLEFDTTKLHWWLRYTQNNKYAMKFKFAHIINQAGKDKLVSTFNLKKPFVLDISGYVLKDVNELSF